MFQVNAYANTSFYSTVGVDNFYIPYTVKVQAYNEKGDGPIGPEATVYSAEGSEYSQTRVNTL